MTWKETIYRYRLHHVLAWLVFGSVWFYLRYQDYSSVQTAVVVTLIKIIDLALLIYISCYFLVPKLLYRKKYTAFFFVFITMIAVSSMAKMNLLGEITNNPALSNWDKNFKIRLYDNILPHFFLVIAGLAIKLISDHFRMQKRLIEIAKEKAETELNFLKSQINPHFLFNSLNAVYFLIDKKNGEARKALHTFSDMLRYQLYEVKGEKLPIEKEIGYLKDYIGLQQLRNENCLVSLNIEEGMKSFGIEPLLLIPFVENSFKHLSRFSNGPANKIQIDLSKKNGEMNFHIRNTIEEKAKEEILKDGGIGLANVKRRLELLYPQKHELKVRPDEKWFDVELKIKMDQ